MKKIIYLFIGVGLIAGLTFWAMNLETKSKATDISLIAFAVEDTASVDKIEIFDSFYNQQFTLTRNKQGKWEGPDHMCVQQEIPNMMLETMYKITLKGYVPQSAMKNMKKLLMAQHKEVKIYQKGKWVKTWYVGHSTRDHMGTHMLLKTPEMESDNPVIMGMKGFYGILEPRFFADARKFECTNLFSYKRTELKEIEVVNRVYPQDSYKVTIGKDNYTVSSNGTILNNVNKDNLTYYLNGFENIHYNQANYTFSPFQVDSIKAHQADYELNIKGTSSSYHLKMYRRPDPDTPQTGDSIIYDVNYLWGIKQDGNIVRIQYYTVGPLIEGKLVFIEN